MTPVERVARAIHAHPAVGVVKGSSLPPQLVVLTELSAEAIARAAISALQEPSEAMVLAMLQAWEQPLGDSIDTSDMTPNWKAAIRAALEEKP